MQHMPTRTVFDVITVASEPTPQEIIVFYMPDDLQARRDELLDKNGEGEITFSEREELERFLNANQMFFLLKTQDEAQTEESQRLAYAHTFPE